MSSRPTLSQIEILVEFLEQNPGIAKGFLRTNQAKMDTKRKWTSLATTLNSLGGANKDGQGWAKYWAEKKCALKKLCAQRSESMRRTGGGPSDNLPMLSALDSRLVAVMGGQEFAVGDSQLAVDPFPQWSQQSQTTPPSFVAQPAEDVESVVEHEVISSHNSPVAGLSQGVESLAPPLHTRSRPRPRRRSIPYQHTRGNVEDMDRLAQIEERRVNAEAVNAQAIAVMAAALEKNAVAVENIASAMTAIARALEGLSKILGSTMQKQ